MKQVYWELIENFFDDCEETVEKIQENIFNISELIAQKVENGNGRVILLGFGILGGILRSFIDELPNQYQVKKELFISIVPGEISSISKKIDYSEIPMIAPFEFEALNLQEKDLCIIFQPPKVNEYSINVEDYLKEKNIPVCVIRSELSIEDSEIDQDKDIVISYNDSVVCGLDSAEWLLTEIAIAKLILICSMSGSGRIFGNSLAFLIPNTREN
ncbi:MAG: hypothetical protein ACK5KR_08025 [Breznakia sp.]